MGNFFIKGLFDIRKIKNKGTFRPIELGYFPRKSKQNFKYLAYFVLYYNGRRPCIDRAKKSLFKKIDTEYLKNFYGVQSAAAARKHAVRFLAESLKTGKRPAWTTVK